MFSIIESFSHHHVHFRALKYYKCKNLASSSKLGMENFIKGIEMQTFSSWYLWLENASINFRCFTLKEKLLYSTIVILNGLFNLMSCIYTVTNDYSFISSKRVSHLLNLSLAYEFYLLLYSCMYANILITVPPLSFSLTYLRYWH